MAMTGDPSIEARITNLARRLGFAGSDASERVMRMALDALENKTLPQPGKMTPSEMKAELQMLRELSAVGRRWREENPANYDESYPPSMAWQEELYDEDGLPK